MHHLSKLAVRRPVAVTVLVLAIILFGAVSLQRTGIDLLPDIDLRVAVVLTPYPNAQAETVEQDVTIPVESALASVSGVQRIESFSMENVSAVLLQFDWQTNMIEALDTIRSSMAQVALQLPNDAEASVVARIDPNEFPLMIIGATSDSLTDLELSARLSALRPRFEQIRGVAEAGLLGTHEPEVQILFDPDELEELGLTPSLLKQLINYQNTVVPGGTVSDEDTRYNVRTGHRIEDLDALGELVIGQRTDSGILGFGGLVPSFVQISDIAVINQTVRQREGFTRLNSQDTVLLRIMPQSGANAVQIARDIRSLLGEIEQTNPELTLTPVVDQSVFITSSIHNLAISGLIGAALAIAVLFLFLRSLHSLLIIAAAIPISIIATFIMVYFGNLSINLMTLGGLALGAGMLVDSSIVVLENIYRHRMDGKDPTRSAEIGSQEIASAIFASTATTLVVFLPVIFMQSMAGELFKELGLTVSFSLVASLLVALTVVPMLTSRVRQWVQADSGSGYSAAFRRLQDAYVSLLSRALNRKLFVFMLVAVAVAGTAWIMPRMSEEFLPEMDESIIGAQAILPAGVPLDATRAFLENMESYVLEIPEVEALLLQAGDQGDADIISQIYGADLYSAEMQIKLVPHHRRQRTSQEVSRDIREAALKAGALRLTIHGSSLFGSAAGVLTPDLVVTVSGAERSVLLDIAKELAERMRELDGFSEVESAQFRSIDSLFLRVDPGRSILGGMTAGQVGLAVRETTTGIHATDLYINNTTLPVVLWPDTPSHDYDGLLDSRMMSSLPIEGMGTASLLLNRVVTPEIEEAPPAIPRADRQRIINVTGQLDSFDLTTAARETTAIIDSMDLPPGYAIRFGGVSELIDDAKDDLFLALFLAICLVYLVLAAQFESFVHPFSIMLAVPLAMVGAIVALWATGANLGVPSLIGMIVLAGIVVNNAIVFVDYINLQRRRGYEIREAVLRAGRIRLRPILMTAATTILGLTPLVIGIGEGAELQVPLATAVIGGLFTSTLLTLFVIPVTYTFLSETFARHLSLGLSDPEFDEEN